MAGLFNKNLQTPQKSQREILASRYFSARHNILAILLFTVINLFLLVVNADVYFLFSAYIPYILVGMSMFLCGMFPEEYYAENAPGMEFLNASFFVVCLIVAVIILLMYLVSWLLTKKPRVGWMIFALVFFAIDTIAMLLMEESLAGSVMDILFHIWALISLTGGVISFIKLKKLPVEPEGNIESVEADSIEEETAPVQEVTE